MGIPWPHASTRSSSFARAVTDSFAVCMFQVKYHGEPDTFGLFSRKLHNRNPHSEFKSAVRRASSVIKTRSLARKKSNVARHVVWRRNALPVWKTRNSSAWIECLHYIFEARLRKHQLKLAWWHSAQHRKDNPAVERVGILLGNRKYSQMG